MLLCELPVPSSQRFVALGSGGKPEEQRADPEKRATADDGYAAACLHLVDDAAGPLGPRRCVEGLQRIGDVEQMVRASGQLLGAWLAGADVEMPVNLHAVGVDHFTAESPAEFGGECRLAACGGPHHDHDRSAGAFG